MKSGRRKDFQLGLVVRNRLLRGSGDHKSHYLTDQGDMDLAWSNL